MQGSRKEQKMARPKCTIQYRAAWLLNAEKGTVYHKSQKQSWTLVYDISVPQVFRALDMPQSQFRKSTRS